LKKVLLIYNSSTGHRNISNKLDYIINFFQKHSELLIPLCIDFKNPHMLLETIKTEDIEFIAIAGGDGTINFVVNLMIKNSIDMPVGIIPGGTCNDLSRCLNIPQELEPALKTIIKGKKTRIDVGLINNEHYFLTTCAGGVFVDVSFKTSNQLKKSFGPLAYYIKALMKLPNLKGVHLKVKTDDTEIDDKFFIFIVLNGEHAAGFTNLLSKADISDGYMDIILIKKCSHIDLGNAFLKTLKNDITSDKNIIHLRTKKCSIEGSKDIPITVDGEEHTSLPLSVEFKERKLEVIL
jgi:diacylglycerol kinase (ATP)